MTAAQWLGLVLQVSIMLTVLGVGLTATPQDATYLLRRPMLLARAVISMNIAMPIIAALIATTFACASRRSAARGTSKCTIERRRDKHGHRDCIDRTD